MTAFLVAAVQTSAFAADTRVTFVNKTGQTIIKGQFSWQGNDKWGSDQLTDYIYPGQSYMVTFDDTYRYWDCRFTLKDGSLVYKYGLDVYTIATLYINP